MPCHTTQGPHRINLYINPLNATLASWSYSHELPPVQEGNIYFINFASIDSENDITLCLNLHSLHSLGSQHAQCVEPIVGVGVAGQNFVTKSDELKAMIAEIPKWCVPVSFVSNYKFIQV